MKVIVLRGRDIKRWETSSPVHRGREVPTFLEELRHKGTDNLWKLLVQEHPLL